LNDAPPSPDWVQISDRKAGAIKLSSEVLAERLMLVIYACGTNCGVQQMVSGAHAHSEVDLRYVRRRRYLTPPQPRQ
jgi:hypothetical protein